ncbi:GIY-YIG nuclease family protein [Clostridiaceae bacterium]|jgi:predicted GIY-YIG superfamily endonuclease|nr:GIY-YIG nuclease family protein [Clostridiaceae bacterium]
MNYTYLLRCADSTLYCGWTNHLAERVKAHNAGRGAKYTRGRRPVALVYYETFDTKEEAMKREAAIKRMTKKEKEALAGRASGSLKDLAGGECAGMEGTG